MIFIIRPVMFGDSNAQELVTQLDRYQIELYGQELCFLDSMATLEKSQGYMLGGYLNDVLVGIGAVKILTDYAELKRMYLKTTHRGSGLASILLENLEHYVKDRAISEIYLETGNRQLAALKFYKKHGYRDTLAFGTYQENEASIYLYKKM